MAKIVFFILVLFIMIYPIFISNNNYKIIKQNQVEKKPLIEIVDAKFKKYNILLESNGTFKKADIYKNYYQFVNLFVNNLIKKEKYFAKWAQKKNNLIKAKDAKYSNLNYKINAKRAVYYINKGFLKGWNFKFFSKNAKGEGTYFQVNKKKNLFAKDITYYIKVEK